MIGPGRLSKTLVAPRVPSRLYGYLLDCDHSQHDGTFCYAVLTLAVRLSIADGKPLHAAMSQVAKAHLVYTSQMFFTAALDALVKAWQPARCLRLETTGFLLPGSIVTSSKAF